MSAASAVWARMTWSKPLFIVFVVTVAWTISLFCAPLTLAPGTFANTTGGANLVDHWAIYQQPTFNWYAKVVYVVGDAQCHQLYYRSLWINGNQMPIDARMTSMYIFGVIGLFWAMMTAPGVTASEGIANAFPPRIQRWARRIGIVRFAGLVVFLGLLPVAVDGFTQLFAAYTQYESTNFTRVATGISSGLVTGLLLGMMIASIKQLDIEIKRLRERASATAAIVQKSSSRVSSED